MNEIKLELKKSCEDGKGVFYRYSIGSFRFWFERLNNGNIYSVNIGSDDKDVTLYMFCNEKGNKTGVYYPDKVEINVKHQRFYVDDSLALLEKIAGAALIATAIENFFKEARFEE